MQTPLAGRRILITEDLYLLAVSLTGDIMRAGGEVAGPYPTCAEALEGIEIHRIDAAILDVALNDGVVFPVARKLANAGIPFVFLTGYEPSTVPEEFESAPCIVKPTSGKKVGERIAQLLDDAGPSRLP